MTRLVALILGLLASVNAALGQSYSGVPYFPQTLPANTVVGRLSSGAGPTEAIPFATLYAAIAATGPTPVVTGGTSASSTLTLKSTSGVGTTDYISFRVGNNGATEALRLGTTGAATFNGAATFGGAVTVAGGVITTSGASLGSTSNPWANVYVGSGGTINFNNGDVVLTHSSNLLAFSGASSGYTFDAGVTVGAGTTSAAGLTIPSGTLMTTAGVGAIEFDGTSFYATAVSGSRQGVQASQLCVLSADYTLTNGTSAQKAFNCSANGAVTVAGSTTYQFEALYLITNTGTTAHAWGTIFAGSATLTSGTYLAHATFISTNVLTNAGGVFSTTPTVLLTVTGSAASADFTTVVLRGTFRINAGGTIIPQVQLSVAPGGTQKMLANSYFRIWPVGNGTVATVGAWN